MKAAFRILVVEDDKAIRRGLVDALKFQSYQVFEADAAPAAMELALTVDCDLILLDLRLPGGDGFSILKQVRSVRPTLAVIILTAAGDEADRVRGLQLGADDYVVKPFSVREIIARIGAVLRRTPARPLDVHCVRFTEAGVTADLSRREARFTDGQRVELSEREIELLRYLARNPSRAVSREELLRNVWLIDPHGAATRTVDMHVARLREKLRDDADRPALVLTVRGKGYMLGGGAAAVEQPT